MYSRRWPTGFSIAHQAGRHFSIIRIQAITTFRPSCGFLSRGSALQLSMENSVQGGAARIPCTLSGGSYVITSQSGRVITRTSYPASWYGFDQLPLPPQRSSIISPASRCRPLFSPGPPFWPARPVWYRRPCSLLRGECRCRGGAGRSGVSG